MGMLILEATDSAGERLAMEAADRSGIAVGWDSELSSATFDSDEHTDEELVTAVSETLAGIDPDWPSHLSVVE